MGLTTGGDIVAQITNIAEPEKGKMRLKPRPKVDGSRFTLLNGTYVASKNSTFLTGTACLKS
jgi:hypothetical protein